MSQESRKAALFDRMQKLIDESAVVIDRPKGSVHPRFTDIMYPFDYGYLSGTTSGDGDGIDVWVGSKGGEKLDAVIITCDLMKKDIEVKLLLGCTAQDMQRILKHHNNGDMSAMLVKVGDENTRD